MSRNVDPRSRRAGILAEAGVLADVDAVLGAEPFFRLADPEQPHKDALAQFLDAGISHVLLVGSDALIAEVLTLHRRHFSAHDTPLQLSVMRAGAVHTVGDLLGSETPTRRALARFKSAVLKDKLQRRQLATLKITSSALPAAQYGFNMGAGFFYPLFEAFQRSAVKPGGGRMLSQATALSATAASLFGNALRRGIGQGQPHLEPTAARLSIDGHPAADQFGYLLASSLERGWLGLRMLPDSPSLMRGDSGRELLARVAAARALPTFLQSAEIPAAAFGQIQLDMASGYVLDGVLFQPEKPYVLQAKAGQPVFFWEY